jgi:hypothetical protein
MVNGSEKAVEEFLDSFGVEYQPPEPTEGAYIPGPENQVHPEGDAPGEFVCPDCRRRVTRGESGTEYGHMRGTTGYGPRCPRRPTAVDPSKPGERT